MTHESHRPDFELDRALAALPRERTPSDGFTDRVVAELGLGAPAARSVRLRRLAAAVAIFAAGLATGYAARNPGTGSTASPASQPPPPSINEVSQVNVPEIGHSEVWF